MSRPHTLLSAAALALAGLALAFNARDARAQATARAKMPAPASGPRAVFVIGEDSYKTAETLPDFAER